MNNNVLDRRPLSETVRKHGSSKMFLAAIILSFVGLGLTLLAMFYELPNAMDIMLAELEMDTSSFAETQAILRAIFGMATIFSIVSAVFSALLNVGLLRGYRYFSGKTVDAGGFDFYLKIYKIVYIVYASILAIPVLILFTALLLGPTNVSELFLSLFFLMPIFAALIIGPVLLCVFQYKAIKKTMDHAMCAAVDIYNGGVSVFLIVITIISIVSSSSSILQVPLGFSTNLTINGEAYISSIFSVLASIPQLISTIFFLVLMFRFKSDMKNAKAEWDWIEGQKAAIARAKAQAEAAAKAAAEAAREQAEADVDTEAANEAEAVVNEASQTVEEAEEVLSHENDGASDTNDDNGPSDGDVFVN